ncbi:MAG: galactose-1-phosphate uridylyltransferase, partial [Clostridiales bacterium]|nr:galactose-1-phosphate uridylyltransferase [Clostridiales bacterium]
GEILDAWQAYDDESVGILSHTGETPHNAVTPIARLEKNEYILDLILRNNRTDEAHPFGIFHPPVELHNIKKEGIGIIEVMGLFILPGRLYEESAEMVRYLIGEKTLGTNELSENHPLQKHARALSALADEYGIGIDQKTAEKAVTNYINTVCEKILECTAVFKNTDEGQFAFERFVRSVL